LYDRVRRRAIFDCCKWHTQAEDRPVLCPFPLVLDESTWMQLENLAAALAAETLAAEKELLERIDLHDRLGVPEALRRGLRRIPGLSATPVAARLMRFDFHWTSVGWRISEANTDAAGGLIEASGVTYLVGEHYPDCRPAGDPAGILAEAILRRVGRAAVVALMHLTIYSEDRQVMLYVARCLEERGLVPCLVSPEQLFWTGGHAQVACAQYQGPVQAVVRFFPAEWLPRLPARTRWQAFLAGGLTPVCNPACAVLSQSKRFALAWDELSTALPTWKGLLPETRSPRAVQGELEKGWMLKPAFGHEGHNIGLPGVTEPADWRRIRGEALRDDNAWAAQRRFETLPLPTPEGPMYPCLGIFVIDGQVAGAYGRLATRPLTDDRSREVAVLLRKTPPTNQFPTPRETNAS
jgi:glutathionylspermidine synthase